MPGFWTRLSLAFRCFFSILDSAQIPEDFVRQLSSPRAAGPAPQPDGGAEARLQQRASTQLLALLQRDGRLVDFLEEDVSPYSDAQLGLAARSVHSACREVLHRYLTLEPVIGSEEDQPVNLPADFDVAAVKLIGNVKEQTALRGILRHRGWQVTTVNLPKLPEAAGGTILAPAEVEIL